jgi:hypothetical protein
VIAISCVAEGATVIIGGLENDLGQHVLEELENGKAVLHIDHITTKGAAE